VRSEAISSIDRNAAATPVPQARDDSEQLRARDRHTRSRPTPSTEGVRSLQAAVALREKLPHHRAPGVPAGREPAPRLPATHQPTGSCASSTPTPTAGNPSTPTSRQPSAPPAAP